MDSPRSSLVSSQEAASRRLPNGCGRELNGLSLYKEKGTASDVRRTAGCIPRHQPHGAMRGHTPSLPEGSKGAYKLQVGNDHVLEESANTRKHCVPQPRTRTTTKSEYHGVPLQRTSTTPTSEDTSID